MIRVLLTDRPWPMMVTVARIFANSVRESNVHVLFLSVKEPSGIEGNFEIINIFDIPQQRTLKEMQSEYSFSLHRAIVPERAFYDYSSFRRSQCYSKVSNEHIDKWVELYANAFDYLLREKVDLVLENSPDCFIPPLCGQIAGYYGKPFRMIYLLYWWSDGALFSDRMDWTSTDIDKKYRHYYDNPALVDHEKLDKIFASKKTYFQHSANSLPMRLRQIVNRNNSYEPLSLQNWVVRRISRVWSSLLIHTLVLRYHEPQDEPFVLYPLHVSPEASLLGTTPELADQFGFIKNISMNLPYGFKLYVKEHPHSTFGDGLDYDFYRRISTLPNVRIFYAKTSIDKLLEHPGFLAVIGISGTVCLDVALKRKPVFIFGRPSFAEADCFIKPANFEDLCRQLMSIQRGEFCFDEQALYAILQALDASITRADVDLSTCSNQLELATSFTKIMRNFVESRTWML